jgi:hypothetical protein
MKGFCFFPILPIKMYPSLKKVEIIPRIPISTHTTELPFFTQQYFILSIKLFFVRLSANYNLFLSLLK